MEDLGVKPNYGKMSWLIFQENNDRFKRLANETGASWFAISRDVNFLSILDQLFTKVVEKVEEIALKLPPKSTKPAIENGR